MRTLAALFILVTATPLLPAGEPTLAQARERWLRGNYAEARGLYETLAKKPAAFVPATVGIAASLRSEGRHDEALALLEAALGKEPGSSPLHAARADLLFHLGRWADAQADVKKALAADKENFQAQWVQAQLYRDQGDLKKAGDTWLWFVRTFAKREGALTDPDDLLLIAQAELERARNDKRLVDQFQTVLKDVLTPLFKKHKDYWPAELEAGRLLFEKYNFEQASKAFDRVLAINPRCAEALVAKGEMALDRYEVSDAEELAEQALRVNPRLTAALRLKADALLTAGATADVLKLLEKARAINPREEATLARIATCLLLQDKQADFDAVVDEVKKHNPKCGVFYRELAERLNERKRYDEAERYFKQALKLRPQLGAARNELGLLYMRLGQEEDARTVLEEANKFDPFNVRVVNSLKVLDHLDTYATIKTPHFLVRHDPKHDGALARVMARDLEKMYDEFATLFAYQPEGPILIEILNNHDMFSGRVVALPDLRTVGACTGRMVAICSPRDKAGRIAKPYNWQRVMRHELVHVFNLEQTKFKVPHWFTEGLAVSLEGFPMPPSWVQLIQERLASGDLMNLDNIHLGFIRPITADDWQLAYLQSLQYVLYLQKAHGKERVGDFLKAYADGLDTEAALAKYCKVTKADFEKGYRQHLQDLAKKFAGRAPRKVLSFKELEAAQAKDPGNADITAQLAERYMLLGDRAQAKKLAEKALAAQPKQQLAAYVEAKLLGPGQREKAIKTLEAGLDAADPELKLLRFLAQLRFEGKEFGPAAAALELGRKADPYDSYWLVELAKVYRATGSDGKLIEALIALCPTDADDLDARRLLADLLLKANRHAEAERYAREALEIDILDRPAQQMLDSALRAQGKAAEADALMRLIQP